MSKINLLTPHLADLIAAGEVVERPGSVIKELVENSIDAGATSITAEIQDGGMTLLRVADNGCGMAPEDAGIAFFRHATSKLRDESGLTSIGSLGFRGEALAAISAVSRIELLTREKGADTGIRVLLEAGDILEMNPAGSPEGCSIIVRDLFFNTPARLKFMKNDRTEGAGCVSAALRCALGAPGVSIRCIRDGKDMFFSPGDGRTDSCVYSLLGREFAMSQLEARSDDEYVSVTGFVGSPLAAKGNRTGQFFFCNGRHIKSKTLTAALEQAYKNSLLSGRFPSCVLYISLKPSCVDVNVHPAKTEVKFSDDRRIFDAVYNAALSALSANSRTAEISLSPGTRKVAIPKQSFYQSMTSEQFLSRQQGGLNKDKTSEPPRANPPEAVCCISSTLAVRDFPVHTINKQTPVVNPAAGCLDSPPCVPAASIPDAPPTTTTFSTAGEGESRSLDFRLIGEALGTYIIAELGDSIVLIDKHAAHERLIFDDLQKSGHAVMSQALLSPRPLTPSHEDFSLMSKNLPLLKELGFELEDYGGDCMILRSIPSDIFEGDAEAALDEICRVLRRGGMPDGSRDELLHTVACKAAIKAGKCSEPDELLALCEKVAGGHIKYCPHGRPVSMTLSKKTLDKQFKR